LNSAVTTEKSDKFSDVTHKHARKWIVNILHASWQERPIGYSVSGRSLYGNKWEHA